VIIDDKLEGCSGGRHGHDVNSHSQSCSIHYVTSLRSDQQSVTHSLTVREII